MIRVTLHYSEALVRRAVGAFWWRTTGVRYVVALSLVLLGLCLRVADGDRSWVVGLLGAGLALGVFFAVALYVVHYRGSLARFRRMRVPEATLEGGEERLCIRSDVGGSDVVWSAITEVWTFPDVWLLFLSRAQFITLGTADLDSAARHYIREKVKANGGKIA